MKFSTRITALVLFVSATIGSTACNDVYAVSLDNHGDQHLWYHVYRVDMVTDGKTTLGTIIKWSARMTTSQNTSCAASLADSTRSFCTQAATVSETGGETKDLETAISVIKAHFEEFKTNNNLK